MRKFTYDTQTLLKEYKEFLQTNYPSLFLALTDVDINLICRYQFIMLHRQMSSGNFKPVRIKYFGVFSVPRSRAIGILNKAKKLLANHKITEEQLKVLETSVNIYLELEDEKDSLDEIPDNEV